MATSRVGRKPVTIPSGVEVNFDQGQNISIKGPKGKLNTNLHPSIKIEIDENKNLKVISSNDNYCRTGSGQHLVNSIAGTIRSNISNMVKGVTEGFEIKLVLVGVGYKAQLKGKDLSLTLGFSHPVTIEALEGITFETPSVTEILVKGADKQLVGHIASIIRAKRPPEPYKGKGVRYANEVVKRKETKKK